MNIMRGDNMRVKLWVDFGGWLGDVLDVLIVFFDVVFIFD